MNKHTLKSDIHRALTGRGFLYSMAGMALVIILSQIKSLVTAARGAQLLPNGYHAQFIMDALSTDWVTLAIPILCALPFTTVFVDDIKSGFIKQYLPRSGTGPYIKGKLIACGLSGGLTLLWGSCWLTQWRRWYSPPWNWHWERERRPSPTWPRC